MIRDRRQMRLKESALSLIGAKPRPRVLLIGFEGEALADVVAALGGSVPTVKRISHGELDDVRQAEWDAAVVLGSVPHLDPHLFVMCVEGEFLGYLPAAPRWRVAATYSGSSVATEFRIPEEVPKGVSRLVRSDLLPLVVTQREHATYEAQVLTQSSPPANVEEPYAFLEDGDGKAIAGRFTREGGIANCWFLPGGVDVHAWLLEALTEWSEQDPERFPVRYRWREVPEWMTNEEVAITSEDAESAQRFRQAAAARDTEKRSFAAKLQAASAAADEGPRRLLTSQGADLVAAVAWVLEEFGFDVVDVDATLDDKAAKLEDLQVRTGTEWVALVEVRGYASGAKLNDLLRIQRFTTRYVQEHQRRPAATWYVVNQYMGEDPSVRPDPLASHPEEVGTFASDGGVVIDTAQLFRLWRAVQREETSQSEARAKLQAASGIWKGST